MGGKNFAGGNKIRELNIKVQQKCMRTCVYKQKRSGHVDTLLLTTNTSSVRIYRYVYTHKIHLSDLFYERIFFLSLVHNVVFFFLFQETCGDFGLRVKLKA